MNVVDGESQVGGVSGDVAGNIFEAFLSAVHCHHAPIVGLNNITWQSFWVGNLGC